MSQAPCHAMLAAQLRESYGSFRLFQDLHDLGVARSAVLHLKFLLRPF